MASGAFEAQIDKMFGTPDQSRLYGSWQLAEGIREGLANHPVGLAPPLRKLSSGVRRQSGAAPEVFLHAGNVKTKIRCEIAAQ